MRNALLPYAKISQVAGQYANHILAVSRLPRSSNPLYFYHPYLGDVRDSLGDRFYEYYRFAFVRNPFDWQKSLYFFMMKKRHLPGNKRIAGMSFDQYMTWRMDSELRFQSDFLFDGAECLVDDVFHFETIKVDFARVTSKLGIDAELPYLNKAGSGQGVTVSASVMNRFVNMHAKEYELLGYQVPQIDDSAVK